MTYRVLFASNSLTRMMSALVGGRPGPWAFISANLSNYTPEQSAQMHEKLRGDIMALGFQPQEAQGGYQGAPERSFFVYGIPPDDAILLGAEFKQHSVLIGQGGEYKLVGTNGESWPEEMLKGNARNDLHVLTEPENQQINTNIANPEQAQWKIPAFTQLDRRDVPKYPGGQKKRITLDPQFAPENRPKISAWLRDNCRFAKGFV